MDRERALEEIHARGSELLTPDKRRKGFVCPLCGSGSGRKGTGITTIDGIHYTCWAGCFKHTDILDIIGKRDGVEGYAQQLKHCAQLLGIPLEDGKEATPYRARVKSTPRKEAPKTETAQNYTEYFQQTAQQIDSCMYHRGISTETLKRFSIGFDSAWKNPKAPNADPLPCLIIPTGTGSYTARCTMSGERRIYNVGKMELFNAAALNDAKQPVFIVEGAIDALSVIDQGGEAVGMGGTSGVNKVLEAVRKTPPKQPIVILPDNDNAGEEAAKRLAAGLEELQIPFRIVHLPAFAEDKETPIKDANDALRFYPSALKALIDQASNTVEEAEDEALDAILGESVLYKLQAIRDSIRTRKLEPFVATGFDSLDKLLGQGLFPGLYFVGATSSLGKTSFCLQLADQIAAQGVDVLYFSLEMATEELVAKSISRLSFIGDMNRNGVSCNAKTTRGVLRGYADYNPEEKRLIDEAFQAYAADVAPFMYITEGIGNIGVQDIRAAVARHTAGTGRKPVVIIDYLQILAPIDFRATDKQNTDKAVLELKRISRDFDIPVIGISSFNRENYRMPVDMNSFKESGAIEYGSDVLIGMQLEGWDYVKGESDAARLIRLRELKDENQRLAEAGQPQRVQLKILKNRTGGRGGCVLEFNPMFNHYGEPYSVSFAGIQTDVQQGHAETRTAPRKRGRAALEDNIRAVAEKPPTGLVRGVEDVQLELIHSSENDSE